MEKAGFLSAEEEAEHLQASESARDHRTCHDLWRIHGGGRGAQNAFPQGVDLRGGISIMGIDVWNN